MSCVLRAIGTEFDVDEFLKDSALADATVFHRGESRLAGGADGAKRAASGFNVEVGKGLEDLGLQVQAARRFLSQHEDELRRLGSFEGVEEICLDFGIRRRGGAAQSDLFPADLLWQAGALDIDLVVTRYDSADDPGLPSGRRVPI
jgi:hypothetical protein